MDRAAEMKKTLNLLDQVIYETECYHNHNDNIDDFVYTNIIEKAVDALSIAKSRLQEAATKITY